MCSGMVFCCCIFLLCVVTCSCFIVVCVVDEEEVLCVRVYICIYYKIYHCAAIPISIYTLYTIIICMNVGCSGRVCVSSGGWR